MSNPIDYLRLTWDCGHEAFISRDHGLEHPHWCPECDGRTECGIEYVAIPSLENPPPVVRPRDVVEPTHGDELAQHIAQDTDAAIGFLYDTYAILRRIHNYGDWDAEYHSDACALWERLGEWMYPDIKEK